jgi:G3E family GTPase
MRVNLLFGFLGSGKTTLAKHLLANRARDQKTAVIVNEFGEVGVDGDILRGDNVDVVELNSGCLCCTLRGSLMLAVEELRQKSRVERVIVEATGVAQPAELLDTLADSGGDQLQVGPLVTVVDAFKFPKLLTMLGDFYADQIENADVIIVNKVDLVAPAQLQEVTRQLRALNPDADLIFAEQGRVRPEELFERPASALIESLAREAPGHEQPGPEHGHDHDHEHDHAHGNPHAGAPVESFTVRGSGNATRAGIERFFSALGDDVYRAKGFLHVDGVPTLVQYSLGQLEITAASTQPSEVVVFIGHAMDRPAIEATFAAVDRP